MKLLAFRVRDFRSVDDTGWIDTEQVTALIGTNEAGKTNVLTPLWKLNPATGGAIDAMADYPRKRYNAIREMPRKPIFIDARFELTPAVARQIASKLDVSEDLIREVTVSRDFEGTYFVAFHAIGAAKTVTRESALAEIEAALLEVTAASVPEREQSLKRSLESALQQARALAAADPSPAIEGTTAVELEAVLASVDLSRAATFSMLTGRFTQLVKMVTGLPSLPPAPDRQAARDAVITHLPSFVYYSNFGNLDAEIYLPHVIENLERTDLGSKEAAKARTLKVLFDFVKLSPAEILSLGTEVPNPGGELTPEQEAAITAATRKKKEREILLLSAGTDLTRRFAQWWKQGSYVFRFQADGNHFRIWVSDAKRPEPIELEARSTGLQWFLSFYLVFLVESADTHKNSILLLDEPGLSLHPLAQKDLSAFFDGLAQTNQLIYTTHSPFMVDTDHLNRARSVYSDGSGVTQVSADLQSPGDSSDKGRSVYVAYAAVSISTADAVLRGSQSVIVESRSDQHYLTAIRSYLVSRGHLRPSRDILFLPGGGPQGTKALASIVTAPDEPLPFVLLDSDAHGRQFTIGLREGRYSADQSRVLAVGDFRPIVDAEVEDLFPVRLMAKVLDRYLRKPSGVEEDMIDVVREGEAFVPQAEAYARTNKIALDEQWKLELARRVKAAVLRPSPDVLQSEPAYLEIWRGLFAMLHPA